MSGPIGGLGGEKPADHEVQAIVDKVRPMFVEQTGSNPSQFTAVSYATQVVAGTNYFIKVDQGDGRYAMLRVYKDLQDHLELSSFQLDKNKDDPIMYFD